MAGTPRGMVESRSPRLILSARRRELCAPHAAVEAQMR
jgi:hypothetical protein